MPVDEPTVLEEAADLPVLELAEAMPGFPGHTRFALVRLDEEGLLSALQSLEEPGLRFLVVPPAAFFPDYAPEIDDETVLALGLESPEDALLLLVVNATDSVQSATVNLLAPVVVNNRTRRARQVVLTQDLPIRAPLVA